MASLTGKLKELDSWVRNKVRYASGMTGRNQIVKEKT
ncbi:MAG TPA: hypothetical protein VD908_17030 [Cytophagales bacterium]|nr:hypothetical protein [Cytophagales bacterium]